MEGCAEEMVALTVAPSEGRQEACSAHPHAGALELTGAYPPYERLVQLVVKTALPLSAVVVA